MCGALRTRVVAGAVCRVTRELTHSSPPLPPRYLDGLAAAGLGKMSDSSGSCDKLTTLDGENSIGNSCYSQGELAHPAPGYIYIYIYIYIYTVSK